MSYRFNIIHPKIDESNKISVYKISFDCGMFYIGSSINMAQRIKQYRYNFYNRSDINKKLKAALNSHNSATIEIVESHPDEQSVRIREDYHIKLNFDNPLLLNRSKSAFSSRVVVFSAEERYAQGNGMRGKKLTKEQRELWSRVKKGIRHSDEHKRKISEAKKGKPLSDSHKLKLSQSHTGKTLSEAHKQNIRGKTNIMVDKYDLLGNFVETYNSYSDAAQSIGTRAGHIGEVVNGKYKSIKGYVFKKHEKQNSNS